MLKNINNLKEIIPNVAKTALHKLSRHLWYLSEKVIGLALFDKNETVDTKIQMVRNLKKNKERQRIKINRDNINRPRINLNEIDINKFSLSDFVSDKTLSFFEILNVNKEFLKIHPRAWENTESYVCAKHIVTNLTVTNDAAERSISLYQNYKKVKNNEKKRQLIQVAEEGRKKFKKLRKQDICEALQE
jgi:hypothetical protein